MRTIEVKVTSIYYCQNCGKDFEHLDVVYFAPTDNNIVCPRCSEVHKNRELRIYIDPNR